MVRLFITQLTKEGEMNFEPLLNASLAIQIHVAFALLAIMLGAYVLWARKRGLHKMMGRVWVGAMVLVALTSFFINEIRMVGPFSPIHILSIITFIGLWRAVQLVRMGRIFEHQKAMKSIYFGALVIPGLLNFIPNRTMHEVAFGNLNIGSINPVINVGLGLTVFVLTLTAIRYYRNKQTEV